MSKYDKMYSVFVRRIIKVKRKEKKHKEKEYGVIDFRPMTVKERWEVYAKLTKPQREVLDCHRKFLIRSEFIQNSYLQASDWEFIDLTIDENYPEKHAKELYCQCGRRLKYQYSIRSKKSRQVILLGSQHFRDHLNLPHHVANEIVKKINNVDVALDEILWLKRQGQEFPTDKWETYQQLLFLNQYSKVICSVNTPFTQRLLVFKEADLPIYEVDYQYLMAEINRLQQEPNSERRRYITDENFERFKQTLPLELERDILFSQTIIWAKQIQQRMKNYNDTPKMPESYFKELHHLFSETDSNLEKKIMIFANRGVGKWIQLSVYEHMLKIYQKYEYGVDFLAFIHPFMREGLAPYIKNHQATNGRANQVIITKNNSSSNQLPQIKVTTQESTQKIADVLKNHSRDEQYTILSQLIRELDSRPVNTKRRG